MTGQSTPGAGPSRPRPAPISVPPQACLSSGLQTVRARTPTRASTNDQEVELGVYLGPKQQAGTPCSISASATPPKAGFSVCESSLASGIGKPDYIFLSGSAWCTDIVTFCSHVRVGSMLGEARITHVQARKSRRPPFLHEYVLVFFTTANDQRFVARIDRLGKTGSASGSWLLPGCCSRGKRTAPNTALQQVEVHQIQESQIGIDSTDGPWCARDGDWDSYPIATLVAWSETNTTTQISHHVQTATTHDGPAPRLADLSRLLEAILLEMPVYRLATTNCYFMTRTSLLLFQRCFPKSFVCFLGSTSDKLVASSSLAEPVWAGLLYWYLPFMISAMLLYVPLVFTAQYLATSIFCHGSLACRPTSGWRIVFLACHGLIDIPLPVGILHAWMTALELEMNSLVTRLSTEYQRLQRNAMEPGLLDGLQPFGEPFQQAWHVLAIWCCIGFLMAAWMLLGLTMNRWVGFGSFIVLLVVGIAYNLGFADGDALEVAENGFAAREFEIVATGPSDFKPRHVLSLPQQKPESEAHCNPEITSISMV